MKEPNNAFDSNDLISSTFELGSSGTEGEFQAGVAVQPQPTEVEPAKRAALILEDDEAQLQILEQYVSSVGLRTISASNLAQARRALAEEDIQIGLFDIQLPDGTGFELCREIDENAELVGLPVIMLSNLQQDSIVRETRAAGASFFLSKPYDPNVLLTLIERALGDVS